MEFDSSISKRDLVSKTLRVIPNLSKTAVNTCSRCEVAAKLESTNSPVLNLSKSELYLIRYGGVYPDVCVRGKSFLVKAVSVLLGSLISALEETDPRQL